MNLPNKLTVGRFFLTILFVVVVSVDFPYHFAVALVCLRWRPSRITSTARSPAATR